MSVRVLTGHAPDVLAALPERSVQTCVTSPPYWSLRRYDTPPQVWDGAAGCAHEWGDELRQSVRGADAGATALAGNTKKRVCPTVRQQGAFCQRCGAWRGELGSEPTPERFVAHLVQVFASVRRVLRDDGTLWVNLGDSYWTDTYIKGAPKHSYWDTGGVPRGRDTSAAIGGRPPAMKTKDLCLVPWRFAIAMQDAGWYVRSTVAWCKTAPMPESVTDRPTNAWEPIFLFTKQARYYYDAAAVREPFADARMGRDGSRQESVRNRGGRGDGFTKPNGIDPSANGGRNLWSYWEIGDQEELPYIAWKLGPEPSRHEHYATYPTEIPRRCIKAGSRPGDTVLDPFGGTGTTGLVADELGRDAILIDLQPKYTALAAQRVRGAAPLFAQVEEAVAG